MAAMDTSLSQLPASGTRGLHRHLPLGYTALSGRAWILSCMRSASLQTPAQQELGRSRRISANSWRPPHQAAGAALATKLGPPLQTPHPIAQQVIPTQQLVVATFILLTLLAVESIAVYNIITYKRRRDAHKVGGASGGKC